MPDQSSRPPRYHRMHAERARAESFGTVAEQYDRFRPAYPAALIEDLIALGAVEALDVGCGTGKAGRQLAAGGMSVLGVEIDPEMAAVARRHGLDVEVCAFEQWDPAGRRFDLVVAGQAWHWVDPTVAVPKAATVLRPGGTIVLFWNIGSIDEPFDTQLDGVYRFRAPHLSRAHDDRKDSEPPYVHDLDSSKLFEPAFVREYEWEESYSTEHWVQMVQTHSDHVTLDPRVRAAVMADVADVIDANGGQILTRYRTHAVFAHVPSP